MYLQLLRSCKYREPNCSVCDYEENYECQNRRPKNKYLYMKKINPGVDYHTTCKDSYKSVPKHMGWLWNKDTVQSPYRPGWKPGKVSRTIERMLKTHNPNYIPTASEKLSKTKRDSNFTVKNKKVINKNGTRDYFTSKNETKIKNTNTDIMKINDLTLLHNTTKQDIKTLISQLTKDSMRVSFENEPCENDKSAIDNNKKEELSSKACEKDKSAIDKDRKQKLSSKARRNKKPSIDNNRKQELSSKCNKNNEPPIDNNTSRELLSKACKLAYEDCFRKFNFNENAFGIKSNC